MFLVFIKAVGSTKKLRTGYGHHLLVQCKCEELGIWAEGKKAEKRSLEVTFAVPIVDSSNSLVPPAGYLNMRDALFLCVFICRHTFLFEIFFGQPSFAESSFSFYLR